MSITAKELAKLLNLSEAAVSMAFNHKPGVSTQTRKKVIAAAKEHDYDFSRIKETSVSTSPHGMIQFIIYKKNGAVVYLPGPTPHNHSRTQAIYGNDGSKAYGRAYSNQILLPRKNRDQYHSGS